MVVVVVVPPLTALILKDVPELTSSLSGVVDRIAVPAPGLAGFGGKGLFGGMTALPPLSNPLTKGGAGVPIGSGLPAKSAGLSPPSAVIVPGAAPALAGVDGVVGRFAEYVILVVACAGTKLFWNCRTVGTLPSGLPVFGSTATPIR